MSSKRQQVYDALVTAFSTSTAFAYVTRNHDYVLDWPTSNCPGVCIVDAGETKSRFCYLQATEPDMKSMMDFSIIGAVHDITNTLTTKRSDLIANIETVAGGDTELRDLTMDTVTVSVETDEGTLENWSIVKARVRVSYLYNHLSP